MASSFFPTAILILIVACLFIWIRPYFQTEEIIPKFARKYEGQTPLLVVINTKSGSGTSQKVFEEVVKPTFLNAGIETRTLYTSHARHLFDLGTAHDFQSMPNVVLMGGDGSLHEILQGVSRRADFPQILNVAKFGLIPTGSSNGLARALHTHSPQRAATAIAFALLRNSHTPIDIYETKRPENPQTVVYDFLQVNFGFFTEIDLLIEGVFRPVPIYDVKEFLSGLWALLFRRQTHIVEVRYQTMEGTWETISDKFTFLVVGTSRWASSTACISEDSELRDGKLFLLTMKETSFLNMALWFLKLSDGQCSSLADGYPTVRKMFVKEAVFHSDTGHSSIAGNGLSGIEGTEPSLNVKIFDSPLRMLA